MWYCFKIISIKPTTSLFYLAIKSYYSCTNSIVYHVWLILWQEQVKISPVSKMVVRCLPILFLNSVIWLNHWVTSTLHDLSTSPFKWQRASAHLVILGRTKYFSPLQSVKWNMLYQKWSTHKVSPAMPCSSAVELVLLLATITQCCAELCVHCSWGLKHVCTFISVSSSSDFSCKSLITVL